jgi:hypothetical protein
VWWYFVRGVTWLYRVSGYAAPPPLDGTRATCFVPGTQRMREMDSPRHTMWLLLRAAKERGPSWVRPGWMQWAGGPRPSNSTPVGQSHMPPWPPALHLSTPASTLCQMLGCFEKRAGPPCRFDVLPLIQAIEVPPPQSQHAVDIASAHNHTPARTELAAQPDPSMRTWATVF